MALSKIVLFGNDPKCVRCNVFKPVWNSKDFVAFAKSQGAEMIDAGMTKFKTTYDSWMVKAKKLGVTVKAFPHMMVLDSKGKVVASFNPSGTAKATIDKIKSLCPDCCDGDCTVPVEMITCPTCNGTGKVVKK